MSASSHPLPLPAGARVAPPLRRAAPERWAAPDPATLVIDPWAPPVGAAVASSAPASWAAPAAHTRVRWMASPAALYPAPALFRSSSSPSRAAEASTERALETLRAIAAAPVDGDVPPPAFAAPDPAARVVSDEPSAWSSIRWRVVALASAAGAALGAGVTLLVTSL